ncbi:MAG: hypothetical protein JST93_19495 [Acidobacteria bacterium]|nr:hypothetical protein [Acidobacteriota bacterium]
MKSTLFVVMIMGAFSLYGQSSRMAEGRYEMKYGRPMPGTQVRTLAGTEGQACCRRSHSVAGAEARNAAKYGRLSAAGEAQQNRAQTQVAAHVIHCVSMGHCDRVESAVARVSESAARFQEKYGRAVKADTPGAECQEACCKQAE